MPERKPDRAKEEFHGSKTTRPEIDLPLKGGRAESDLSKNQPKKDERSSFNKPLRK